MRAAGSGARVIWGRVAAALQAALEGGDDGPIGGGEVVVAQLARGDPGEGGVLMGGGWRAARGEAADEGRHVDHDRAVVVEEAGQGADDDGLAAELLAQFAEEGGRRGLAGLDLAAGEFPFQAEVFVGGPLGEENQAGVILDDGTDDGERRGGGGRHGGRG